MANYNILKTAIQNAIKANGNNAITGPVLQSELISMVNVLGAGYQYFGVAQPSTNPGNPDSKCFFVAYTPGTYVNFDGIIVTGLCILKYDTVWRKEDISISGGGGSVVTFESLPNGTTVILVDGTPMAIIPSQYTLLKLSAFTTTPSDVTNGAFYYNTSDKKIYQRRDPSTAVIPYYDGAIYTYNNALYVWNGTDLVNVGNGGGGADFLTEPDDLTLQTVGDTNLLKFANRQYNSLTPNGLGFKILRGDSTFAQQVTAANTIYEIRYEFDLNGGTVTIPANCVLYFNGGKITNGTLVGNNTIINAPTYQIFSVGIAKYRGYSTSQPSSQAQWGYAYVSKIYGPDVEISGTWGNAFVNPAWVGLDNCAETEDSALKIQRFIDLHKADVSVVIPQGKYSCYKPINVTKSVDFSYSTLKICRYSDIYDSSIELPTGALPLPVEDTYGLETPYGIIQIRDTNNSHYLRNVIIDGNRENNAEAVKFGIAGLLSPYLTLNNYLIENVTLKNSNACGFIGGNGAINATLRNCLVEHTREHGLYNHFNSGSVIFENCTFRNVGDSQEMIDARSGASYIWKLTQLSGNSTLTSLFYRCVFENTTSLSYRGSFQFDGMDVARFKYCEFTGLNTSYLGQDNLLTHIYLENCSGYVPVFRAKNTIFSIDGHIGGEFQIDNSFKSVKNSRFTIRYNGTPTTDFVGDYVAEKTTPIEIENCDITVGGNMVFGTISEIVFDTCRLHFQSSTISMGNADDGRKTTFRKCVVLSDVQNIGSLLSGNTLDLIDTFFLLSDEGYIFDARGTVNLKNVITINGVLLREDRNPTVTDNTDYTYRYKSSNISRVNRGNYFGLIANLTSTNSGINAIVPNREGVQAFSTTYGNIPVWWNGTRWQNALGEKYERKKGTTAQRPTLDTGDYGFMYYDTTLNKMILWNGTAWVNMDGTALA